MKIHYLLFYFLLTCSLGLHAEKYVGNDSCKNCHAKQTRLWKNSHHDLAMQHANDDSVLGDFSNATFSYAGITSTFYEKNKKFMARTDGADGKLHDYEIKYTFGVSPLQQYLIELEGGHLQALTIAWDTRKKTAGGQRWFHLYPDEKITYQDELHWTRPVFNWNSMCAECHSTNLKKNYDSKTHTFKTSWSEINVSCEACHGPASNHLSWTKTLLGRKLNDSDKHSRFGFSLDERRNVSWKIDNKTGTAQRSQQRETSKEIEVCAQCHSRRSAMTNNYEPGKSFADHYQLRLLDENMYFADGQIQDEVYVHGSFLQSKMYHAGVTCSDCHEPHSLKLRQEGNGVCLQCHMAEKFDTKKHHFHKDDSTGALCAECHMPTRNYMVVDPRHDHSIRIPRPDQSLNLGTPNACNNCHKDKKPEWAAKQVKTWYGHDAKGFQSYAVALHDARQGKPATGSSLADLIRTSQTPDIARATAISHIPPYLNQSNIDVIQLGLNDSSPNVRAATVSALESVPEKPRRVLTLPLLNDNARSVRIEAARIIAATSDKDLSKEQKAQLEKSLKEYIETQLSNAERPESQTNLGSLYVALGEFDKALQAFNTAIELNPVFVPAYINLADAYRAQGNEVKAEEILRRILKHTPDSALAYHALGLSLIRQQRNTDAVKELRQAATLDPDNARYIYVYAVALNSTGDPKQAVLVLKGANVAHPNNIDILNALVAFHRDLGNEAAAKSYARKLQAISP